MVNLAVLLLLLTVIFFIVGMIKPTLAIWWGKKRTRGVVAIVTLLSLFISIVLAGVGAPSEQSSSAQANTANTVSTTTSDTASVDSSADTGESSTESPQVDSESNNNAQQDNLNMGEVPVKISVEDDSIGMGPGSTLRRVLTVTSLADSVTVNNIIVNRGNDAKCERYGASKLPITLAFGESAHISYWNNVFSTCELLEVTVETNLGSSTFRTQ